MSLQQRLVERGIEEVVHFTTHRGLVGTLAKGQLLSRHKLREDEYLQHILHANTKIRPEDSVGFDKSEVWINFVNLSLSEINRRFFDFSGSWESNQGVWWAILSFDPVIVTHSGVYFATTNNGYEHCSRGLGESGFDALFSPAIGRKGNWRAYRGTRADHLPTCEQAELLYPDGVSVSFLRKIYVQSPEHEDQVRAWLRLFKPSGVEVFVDTGKFKGMPN